MRRHRCSCVHHDGSVDSTVLSYFCSCSGGVIGGEEEVDPMKRLIDRQLNQMLWGSTY